MLARALLVLAVLTSLVVALFLFDRTPEESVDGAGVAQEGRSEMRERGFGGVQAPEQIDRSDVVVEDPVDAGFVVAEAENSAHVEQHLLRVIVTAGGAPLEGVEVDVFVRDDDRGPVGADLCAEPTDAEGAVEVAWPAEAGHRGRLHVSVVHPGFLPLVRVAQASEGARSAVELELQPGASVVGRLLDGEGEPLGGPLKVLSARSRAQMLEWDFDSALCTALPDGRFATGRVAVGATCVVVEHQAHGRSLPIDVQLLEAEQTDLGDVRLPGGGEIAGRLLLPDGSALGSGLVTVEARRTDAPFDRDEPMAAPSERGTTRPDGKGRFRLRGLLPGSYVLTVMSGRDVLLETPKTYSANTTGLELTVDAWWLLLRAWGADGELVALGGFDHGFEYDHFARTGGGVRSSSTRAPFTEEQLVLPRTGTWFVRGRPRDRADHRMFTAFVEEARPGGRHDVDLSEETDGLATLELRTIGELLPPGTRIRATLRPERSGWQAWGTLAPPGNGGPLRWERLAPGRYTLRIDLWGEEIGESVLALAEPPDAPVVLTANSTTVVDLPIRAAGLFELTFVGVEHAEAEGSLFMRDDDGEWDLRWATQRVQRDGAEDWVSTGTTFDLAHPIEGPQVLPTGQHEVRIEAAGYRPVELEVDIAPGVVTRLDVPLEPEE